MPKLRASSGLIEKTSTKDLNVISGDTSATSTTVADADRVLLNDNGTMVQVAVTDLAAYFDDEITSMPNLVETGALNAGSITSGFGTIDTGSSTITTTGNITGGTLTSTGNVVISNGGNIGSASDTDAIVIASNGNVTLSQNLSITGDLTVSGTTTTVDSTVLTVVDPIIHLQTATGGGALGSDTNKDVGLAMQYHNGSAAKTAFVGFDDNTGKLIFVPDATINSEVVSGTKGTIVADLEGNVTGNIDGNLTGTLQTAAQGNVTSLGTLTALAVDNIRVDGSTIGHTDDTDLMTLADGVLTVAGEVSATTLDIGGTNISSTATELNLLDGSAKSTSSITLADTDAIIVIDGTTTKQIPVSDIKTYNPGGTAWQAVVTGNTTMTAGRGYFVNTTSAAITMTLPAGSIGDQISLIDYAGTFDSNNLTVAANGSEKIHGSTDDLTVATERAAFTLVFTDSTQGWLLTNN